jgi:hypothetical protein
MEDARTDRKQFTRGMLLALVPIAIVLLPTIIHLVASFSNQKATGIGAVAGGVSEAFATFGVIAFLAAEICGCLLLARSKTHGLRKLLAILSICLAATTVLFVGLAIAMLIWLSHR